MPENDLTGVEAVNLLQQFCDDADAHLWLDLEAFLFHEKEYYLIPRPIDEIKNDLYLFDNFERWFVTNILGYLMIRKCRYVLVKNLQFSCLRSIKHILILWSKAVIISSVYESLVSVLLSEVILNLSDITKGESPTNSEDSPYLYN